MYARVLVSINHAYSARANGENYSRVIIISLVWKYAANTIRGRKELEGEIYSRKYSTFFSITHLGVYYFSLGYLPSVK